MAPWTNSVKSTWMGVVPVNDTALAVTDTRGPGLPGVGHAVRELAAARDQEVC